MGARVFQVVLIIGALNDIEKGKVTAILPAQDSRKSPKHRTEVIV